MMDEPDFSNSLHGLESVYGYGVLLLLCKHCGFWELVKDRPIYKHEMRVGWVSSKVLPCKCQICGASGYDAVDDDQGLMYMPEDEGGDNGREAR